MPRFKAAVCLRCHQKVWTKTGAPVRCRCGELEVAGTGEATRAHGAFVELVDHVVPYQQLPLPF